MLERLKPLPVTGARAAPAPARLAVTTALVALAATVVSAAASWVPSFWGDEAASLMSAQRPLPTLFAMLGNVDAVHGAYYLFLHFWIDLFGASPLSVRMPSAIAVGVAAAGVVLLTDRLGRYRAAVYAGAVAIILPRLTLVGTEARSYALSAACAIWLTVILVRLMDRHERRLVAWWGYAALFALSIYLFAFSALIGLAHGIILLLASPASRRLMRPWSVAAIAGVAVASPVLFWGYAERSQIAYLNERPADDLSSIVVGQWFGNPLNALLAWAAMLYAVAVVLVSLRSTRARILGDPGRRTVLVSAMVAFVPVVALLTVNIVTAVYTNRYLAMSAPAVAILIGFALSRLPRWGGAALLIALTVTALPAYLDQRGQYAKNDSDWAQVAQVVQQHATAGDAVVFDESTRPSRRLRLAMHSYPAAFHGLADPTVHVPYTRNNWWWDSTKKPADVPERFDGIQRVWLLEYKAAGEAPDRYGMSDLQALGFRMADSYDCHTSVVYEFVRAGADAR